MKEKKELNKKSAVVCKKCKKNDEKFDAYSNLFPVIAALLLDGYAYNPLNTESEEEICDYIYKALLKIECPLKKSMIIQIMQNAYDYIECEEAPPYEGK